MFWIILFQYSRAIEKSNRWVYRWTRRWDFQAYIHGRLTFSGWLLYCITIDWCNETKCGGTLHYLHFWHQYTHGVPEFSYTWEVNSKKVSFIRNLDCSISLRSHGLSAEDTSLVKMKRGSIPSCYKVGWWALFELSTKLRKLGNGKNRVKNENREWILDGILEP